LKLLRLCLVILISVSGFAQQYNFISYDVKDGLATSQVTDICQDNLGNLWLGTISGLSKFNSHSFQSYSIDDGLADNKISQVMLSSDNRIWVATPKGLSVFNNHGEFKSFPFKTIASTEVNDSKKINGIIEYRDSIYLSTEKHGIFKFNGIDLEEVVAPIPGIKYRVLTGINDSIIFCATNGGLYVYEDNQFHLFDIEGKVDLNVSDVKVLGDRIFISTIYNGVIVFDLSTRQIISEYATDMLGIKSIYVDENEVLVASNFGMMQVTNSEEIFYSERNGLTTNKLNKIIKDKEGNIWIATDGKGLLKFSGKSIMTYSVKEGLSADIVMSINQLTGEEFVFGTLYRGVDLYLDGKVTSFDSETGLNRNAVWSTCVDNSGICWVGTSEGVNCIKSSEVIYHAKTSEITGRIRSIYSRDSSVYFGGTSGLWHYANDSLEHLLKDNIYDVYKIEMSSDRIFLGTSNGLFWHDFMSKTLDFNHLELPVENINTVCLDSYDNLWVGTTNGLFIISPDLKSKNFRLDNSNFKSKNIMGITKDGNGQMWFSTNNGVFLLSNNDPFKSEPTIFHYTLSEGMIDMECNLNAIYEDKDGFVWVGTSTGLARINPKLNRNLFTYQLPQLSITGIRLFKDNFDFNEYDTKGEKPTGIPEEITFPFKKNHVTFDFIGINNKNPQNVYYSYRLLGAEEDWSSITSENSATYSFISPGLYEFQVKAANKNYEWTEPVTITLIIRPPYWQTWWFISLIVLVIIAVVYYILRFRLRQVNQKKDNERLVYENKLRNLEQRSLNASMNRHFIFNSLNSIQYFINSSDKKSANKFLTNFAQLIRKNLDSSTQPNFLVSLGEEMERINLYLTLEKMRFNEKFDYSIEVDDAIDEEMINVPSMILQPFVENSIIHGVLPKEGNGTIKIHIKEENNSIVFEVEDDGVGIDDSLNQKEYFIGDHKSQGMEITANRVDLLRKINGDKLLIIGPFQVNDQNGDSTGTKVIIKLPIY